MRTRDRLRVLVALDPAAPNPAAVEAARCITGGSRSELVGLFVEDTNLLALASLPCAREITFATATERKMDATTLRDQLQSCSELVRREFESAARRLAFDYSFKIRRGEVIRETRLEAEDSDALIVGRSVRTAGSRSWLGAMVHALAEPGAPTVVFVQEGWATGSSVLAVLEDPTGSADIVKTASAIAQREKLALKVVVRSGLNLDVALLIDRILEPGEPEPGTVFIPDLSVTSMVGVAQQQDARALVFGGDLQTNVLGCVRQLLERTETSLVILPPRAAAN